MAGCCVPAQAINSIVVDIIDQPFTREMSRQTEQVGIGVVVRTGPHSRAAFGVPIDQQVPVAARRQVESKELVDAPDCIDLGSEHSAESNRCGLQRKRSLFDRTADARQVEDRDLFDEQRISAGCDVTGRDRLSRSWVDSTPAAGPFLNRDPVGLQPISGLSELAGCDQAFWAWKLVSEVWRIESARTRRVVSYSGR